MAYRTTERTEARRAATRERIVAAALRADRRGRLRQRPDRVPSPTAPASPSAPSTATSPPSRSCSPRSSAGPRSVRSTRCGRRDATGGSAAERIAAGIETFARRALAGRRLAWALLAEPVDPAVEAERLHFRHSYRDVIAEVLAEGIDSGELPDQDAGRHRRRAGRGDRGGDGRAAVPHRQRRRSRSGDRLPDQLLHLAQSERSPHMSTVEKSAGVRTHEVDQPAPAARRLQRLRGRPGDGRGGPPRGRGLGRRARSPRSARSPAAAT